jgi:hypothetical protein
MKILCAIEYKEEAFEDKSINLLLKAQYKQLID